MIFFSYLKAIVWSKSMLWLAIGVISVRIIFTQGLLSKVYPTLPDLWFILAWIVLLIAFWYCMTSYETMANKVKELNKVLPIKRWLVAKCPALARISMETLVRADDMSIFWLEPKEKATSLARIWENYIHLRKWLPNFVEWVTERSSDRTTNAPTKFTIRIASEGKVYFGFDNSKHWPGCPQWRMQAKPYVPSAREIETTFTDGAETIMLGRSLSPYVGDFSDVIWKALFIATNFRSIRHYEEIQKWLALTRFLADTKNGKIGSSPILGCLRETIMESMVSNDYTDDEFLIALSRIDLGKQKQKRPQTLADALGKKST
ncbi:MAG: hypothetical protein WCI57_04840 [Candidatus Berkelbacteria bacterium]